MKTAAILAAALALNATAAPACERFRVWRYPWPQACHQRAIFAARIIGPARAPTPATPSLKPRDAGISPADLDKLKAAMRGKVWP